MADSISQRVLQLARVGLEPADIAHFLGCSEQTVLADLADLTVDGASQEQRILSLIAAGHHVRDVADWVGCPLSTVLAAIAESSGPIGPSSRCGPHPPRIGWRATF